ncbi:MAG: branched-chain amino acid ABC transporter permease [Pseudomonas sp.]|uniref:branched-chain amino acid ABC transporter permease n=1 Tax=Pseudomonas sp. TaxID=306 RepID=UPI003D6DACA8
MSAPRQRPCHGLCGTTTQARCGLGCSPSSHHTPGRRLPGHCHLGFAECLRLVITHQQWATRSSLGIANIARPVSGDGAFVMVCLIALALVFVVMERVAHSPFGRVARALRHGPLVVAAMGKNVLAFRVRLFALGGAALGLAGSLHAFYYQYIDPTRFGPIITGYAFMAVIIGGRGSNKGVLLSAFTVVLLLESSRLLNDYIDWLSAADLASLRLLLINVGLILIMVFRPQGMLREHCLHTTQATPSAPETPLAKRSASTRS